jgi:hypothetical protein
MPWRLKPVTGELATSFDEANDFVEYGVVRVLCGER